MPVRCALIAIGLAALLSALPKQGWIELAAAQQPTQNAGTADQQLTPDALQQLVGPIALYPDDLLSVVLPASTQPLQIVEAQRFLDRHKTDTSLKPPTLRWWRC